MAVFRATGGSEEGFEAFDGWSQKAREYAPDETRARWEHYYVSPPSRTGLNKLICMAHVTDPSWVPPTLVERQEDGSARFQEMIAASSEALRRHADGSLRRKPRFQARKPGEDENLPPLTYYDRQQTLPCLPDGGDSDLGGHRCQSRLLRPRSADGDAQRCDGPPLAT